MAGVPLIMQSMLDEVAPTLKTGVKMLSESVRADLREGDIGTQLGEIAKNHPDVMIGSYPFPGWLEFASQHLPQFGPADVAEAQDDAVITALHDQLAAGRAHGTGGVRRPDAAD
jgi:molybdopterin-biosynthesis enzyme MoeA-like protein